MAQWRTRRGLTQQVLADRIGRSKSWVDKVERGQRNLDRLPMIETVAAALGITPEILLDRDTESSPPVVTGVRTAVERVRDALACHHPRANGERPTIAALAQRAKHAWAAYRHAHHNQVLRALPDLLHDLHRTRDDTAAPNSTTSPDLPLRIHCLTAQTLIKIDQAHLAWLAADRAMHTAVNSPHHFALAAIPLAQALRALGHHHLATDTAVLAVSRLAPAHPRHLTPAGLALTGTLLTEAALAAAAYGDASTADHHLDRATRLAAIEHNRVDRDGTGGFGPVTVDLARAVVAAELGNGQRAITIHTCATSSPAWHRLAPEHRAAYLIDITRAYLGVGDTQAAGRALIAADRIAPAETRIRPAARQALTAVLDASRSLAPEITRLAITLGLHRP